MVNRTHDDEVRVFWVTWQHKTESQRISDREAWPFLELQARAAGPKDVWRDSVCEVSWWITSTLLFRQQGWRNVVKVCLCGRWALWTANEMKGWQLAGWPDALLDSAYTDRLMPSQLPSCQVYGEPMGLPLRFNCDYHSLISKVRVGTIPS